MIGSHLIHLLKQILLGYKLKNNKNNDNDIEIYTNYIKKLKKISSQQMQKSRQIKLYITNNQSHSTILQATPSEQNYSQREEGSIVEWNDFMAVTVTASRSNKKKEKENIQQQVQELFPELEENQQSVAKRSMFTIREEQSYEYSCSSEEQNESRCRDRKDKFYESYIDDLSTIKADNFYKEAGCVRSVKENYDKETERQRDRERQRERVKEFEVLGVGTGEKFVDNPTMASFCNIRIMSQQNLSNHIQNWDSKFHTQPSLSVSRFPFPEQVQQQQFLTLKPGQKSLKLDLMRMHKSQILLQPDQKIKKNYDIVYNCSEEEFVQIRRILEKEGIRFVHRCERIQKDKENVRDRDGDRKKKLGFKKKSKLNLISRNT